MGVGADHQFCAALFRRLRLHVVQIQALGAAVDLQRGPRADGRVDQLLEIDLVGLPLPQEPAGGMAQDIDVPVLHRLDDPRRHLLAGHPQPGVHRAHHDIELPQHLIRIVQPAVGEDIALRAHQDRDPDFV